MSGSYLICSAMVRSTSSGKLENGILILFWSGDEGYLAGG